jgi:hypothetical protein
LEGFYVAVSTFDKGILYGESTIWWIPVSNPVPVKKFTFLAQIFQPRCISPNGSQVALLIDYGGTGSLAVTEGGEPREFLTYSTDKIGLYGWAPPVPGASDSECLVYWQEDPLLPSLMCALQSKGLLTNAPVSYPNLLRWVDSSRFLYVTGNGPRFTLFLENWEGNVNQLEVFITYTEGMPPYDFIP